MQRRSLASLALVLSALAARPVAADDRATAQQLFAQGKALLAKGKVAEACAKFQGAAELSQTHGVRLNLAACWNQLGKTASAWAMYDEALTLAERAGDTAAADLARKTRKELEPKLAYLTIQVPPGSALPGLELQRDGKKLPEAAWGASVPVDPGSHEVVAEAPGHQRWAVKLEVGVASKESLVVPPLARSAADSASGTPSEAPVAATSPAADPAATEPSSGGTQRTVALIAGGLGIVGLGVGSYFGLRAISKKNDYESQQGPGGECLNETCETTSHDAYTAGTISTIAFVAGGALLGTGAVLWLTAPSGPEGEASGFFGITGKW
jgi:hypothetical protein